MKPVILIPIIIGSVVLTACGVLLGIGIVNNARHNKIVTREVVIEESFHNIDIDFDVTDVTFVKSSESKSKIVYKEREKEIHTSEVKDDTLVLRSQDTRKWYEKIFVFNYSSISATIYLNETSYSNLNMKVSTGDITLPGEFTYTNASLKLSTGDTKFESKVTETLKVEASTGNCTLKDVTAKNIELKASTGKETLENVTVEEDININVSTGNTVLTNTKSKNLTTKSSTGKVTLNNSIISNHVDIKCSTGDVKLNDSDADTLKIETSTGDVKGTLLTSKIFYVTTDTGKINVPVSTTGGLCEVKTSTGDVTLSIKA